MQRLVTFAVALFVYQWFTSAARAADPVELAAAIDKRLDARLKQDKIQPAPLADDAEFLRRLSLDLNGRIPASADVYEFLADKSANKRRKMIDRLLADPRYAVHFANVLRAELAPEITANPDARAFQIGFESWLRQQLRAGVPYDELVRRLLTVSISGERKNPEPVLRDPEKANPLAFFAVKDARPENLAAAVSRTFLGIRLECAQCHDHPFAKWKQEQFWAQAAFFAGVDREGRGIFAPISETVAVREVTPTNTRAAQKAEFLDGKSPKWKDDLSSRVVLADWITAKDNPFFARATANRVWGHFFGVGIVEPVDDFRDDNPPSDGELLDLLAKAFVAADFDMNYLIRGITMSRAYQRSSKRTHASQDDTRLPARMTVKALTGEQFFDSLALATGYRDEQDRGATRRQFLSRFAQTGAISDPETSVQQALTMLNGRFVAFATDPDKSPTLLAITGIPGMTRRERVEALFVITLSRKPTTVEYERVDAYFANERSKNENQRLADVFWALLNLAEFRLNH